MFSKLSKTPTNPLMVAVSALALALVVGCGAGEDGDPGAAGQDGADGTPGADGEDGANGLPGADGEDGADGAPGADGEDGAAGENGVDGKPAAPATISLPGRSIYPEGIAMDALGTLYISSFVGGTVFKVEPDAHDPEILSEGVLTNAAGIIVDDTGSTLWACDSFLTVGFTSAAAIVGIDLQGGAEIARHELPAGPDVCNDLVQDKDGNIYATSSFSNRIFRVAATDRMSTSAAETWDDTADYATGFVEGFGLNGIAYDGDGALFVVSHATNRLFRTNIDPTDGSADHQGEITLKDPMGAPTTLDLADGVEFLDSDTLMVAQQGPNSLSLIDLASSTLTPLAGGLDNPSTFALDADGDAWVVNSQLNDFAGGTAPTLPFQVVEVPLGSN